MMWLIRDMRTNKIYARKYTLESAEEEASRLMQILLKDLFIEPSDNNNRIPEGTPIRRQKDGNNQYPA